MSINQRTEPVYQIASRESDIADFIPGDRVKVRIDEKRPKWKVYGGHKYDASLLTKCTCIYTFIDIPEGYKGEDVYSFRVWKNVSSNLLFPGSYIEFINSNSRGPITKIVKRKTEEYQSMKTLADMLVQK